MLILSRRPDQKIRFPGLGISIQVLRVQGTAVRLGIDAPTEVRIIRDELEERNGSDRGQAAEDRSNEFAAQQSTNRSHVIRLPRTLRHELRNELNALSLALHLFKQELEAGQAEDAEATFEKLIEYLERICANQALSSEGVTADAPAKRTALLVEDEPNEREMLAGFLRLQGYQVATAADGLEAMEYLESHEKPSVLLVDMRMPRCDGPTTIRTIRDNPAFDRVKIFVISGSAPEENHGNWDDVGVNGWFMKPLNPRTLVDAMAITTGDVEPTAA